MKENPFAQLYSTKKTKELISILAQQSEYQPLAITAAKEELQKRNIDTAQISEMIKNHIETDKPYSKFNAFASFLKNTLFIFSSESPAQAYVINSISILLFVHYFLDHYKVWSDIPYLVSIWSGVGDKIVILWYYGLLLWRFVFIVLFWQRVVVGWMFVFGYAIEGFIYTCLHFYYVFMEPAETERLIFLFPERGIEYFVFWWAYFYFLYYFTQQHAIKKAFSVNNIILVISAIAGFFLALQYAL